MISISLYDSGNYVRRFLVYTRGVCFSMTCAAIDVEEYRKEFGGHTVRFLESLINYSIILN